MTVSQIMKKMIAFLVGHHHTFTGIDNVDWQILVEADYVIEESVDVIEVLKPIFNYKAG
jgi:hypothetical protein